MQFTSLLKEDLAARLDMLAETQKVTAVFKQRGKQSLSFNQRQTPQVMPIHMKQIKDKIAERLLHSLLKRSLQIGKAGVSVLSKHYHLAVQDRLLRLQVPNKRGNRLHPMRPIQPRPRQQLNFVAVLASLNPIAIKLQLMQPACTT